MTRRVTLKVVATPGEDGLVPCLECGQCCTYVAVGVNTPRTPRYATDILWYLYHGVGVHLDVDGEWSVMFEARCHNLGANLACEVYPKRPHICREFDNTGCEVNAPGGARTFTDAKEFLAYLRERRPKLYEKIRGGFVPRAYAPTALRSGRKRPTPAKAGRPRKRTSQPARQGR